MFTKWKLFEAVGYDGTELGRYWTTAGAGLAILQHHAGGIVILDGVVLLDIRGTAHA